VPSEELCILASWFLSLMSKNSVLEELKSKKISSYPGKDLLERYSSSFLMPKT